MVPTTPGDRFVALLAHIPDGVSYASLDRAAGLRSVGTAKQLAAGDKAGPRACAAFAPVLGTTEDYLLLGRGKPPGRRAVQAAIRAAVGVGDEHGVKVRGNPGSRKGYDRAAAPTSGASR